MDEHIYKTIKNQKALIILFVIISVFLTALYLNSPYKSYDAKASILVRTKSADVGLLNAHLQNERNKILSPMMAKAVIEKLNLEKDPEFNTIKNAPDNIIDNILSDTKNSNFKKFAIRGISQENEALKIFYDKPESSTLIEIFLNKLDVQQIPNSSILEIQFGSPNTAKAILITNVIADLYVQQTQPDFLAEKNRRASKLKEYNARLKSLEMKLESAKNTYLSAAESVEIDRGQSAGKSQENNEQIMAELGKQLITAKAREAEARAKLQIIKNGNLHQSIAASRSNVLNALKIKEAEMLQDVAALSDRYGPKYPKITAVEKSLDAVREQMAKELKIVAAGVRENLKIAEARVLFLEAMEERLKNLNPSSNIALEIEFAEAERNYNQARTRLNYFVETANQPHENLLNQEVQTTKIISYAVPPLSIQRLTSQIPKLLWAVLLSFLASFFIAWLLERNIKIFRTIEELEGSTGFNCLGLIPAVPTLKSQKPIADYIISKDASRVAESIRTLRMVLNLRAHNLEQKSKVITMTSSLPDEGKTTISTWLARIAAKSGERVIVVDCDLRRPRLHEAFDKNPQNTIVEYLTGKCTLEEALYRDPATNMHAIFGRSVPNNALDLISKDRMANLIGALREQYDLVILDSPACLSVSDARLLATQADQTLYVVSWNDTEREVVNAGLKQFADVGCDAVTLVLNNVDLKRYTKYGFNDAVHYYSAYNPYYAD